MNAINESPRCVLTGAHGFVGAGLKSRLQAKGWLIEPWSQKPEPSEKGRAFHLGETIEPASLEGVRAVIHCAYDFKPRSWSAIKAVNVSGSKSLFDAARKAGVQTLILISTISAFPGCRSLYGKAKLEIEEAARAQGAFIIRPGLVYDERSGGVFGRLEQQVKNSRFIPALTGGRQAQFLVHLDDLARLILDCLNGRISPQTEPITIAHEQSWELKNILLSMAAAMDKRITLVPVPWQLVWLCLKTLETAGVPTNFRSDSLISMVYQNPDPSFALLKSLGIHCRPFETGSLARAPGKSR
jgi:nucleoside-diphosphate-sugar epimerase